MSEIPCIFAHRAAAQPASFSITNRLALSHFVIALSFSFDASKGKDSSTMLLASKRRLALTSALSLISEVAFMRHAFGKQMCPRSMDLFTISAAASAASATVPLLEHTQKDSARATVSAGQSGQAVDALLFGVVTFTEVETFDSTEGTADPVPFTSGSGVSVDSFASAATG